MQSLQLFIFPRWRDGDTATGCPSVLAETRVIILVLDTISGRRMTLSLIWILRSFCMALNAVNIRAVLL